eukprot:2843014-Pleurochrysis_carterae.AAC.2
MPRAQGCLSRRAVGCKNAVCHAQKLHNPLVEVQVFAALEQIAVLLAVGADEQQLLWPRLTRQNEHAFREASDAHAMANTVVATAAASFSLRRLPGRLRDLLRVGAGDSVRLKPRHRDAAAPQRAQPRRHSRELQRALAQHAAHLPLQRMHLVPAPIEA